MVLIQLIIICALYFVIILSLTYFASAFLAQEADQKADFSQVITFYRQFLQKIRDEYLGFRFIFILVISAACGIFITLAVDNWLFNSGILFLLMFIIFPVLVKSFENAYVTTGSSFKDEFINAFIKHNPIILLSYGTGNGGAIIYNWIILNDIHFVWFIFNFLIISILLGIIIKKMIVD